jgi:hypothetical protein
MTLSSTSLFLCALCALGSDLKTGDPCQSGLQPGLKPGPYTAIISTGPARGQSYCYICETGDRPAVVVFARSLSDPLGKLVQKLDKAIAQFQGAELRAWVTFLNDNQTDFDPKVVQWSQRYAIGAVPLGVFESSGGPPSYRLARDADVTVLLFVKRRVSANFAFRAGELTDADIEEVMKALPRITAKENHKPPAVSNQPQSKK